MVKTSEIEAERIATLEKNKVEAVGIQRLSGSKLRDLAWSLDVLSLKKEKGECN